MADLTAMLQAAAGAGGGAETDPNFNQTTLLLHGDGTNGAQNNTFLDSSTNNFTITRNGNTTQGTFSPFSLADGQWSNYFDGTGDFISVADSADFTMGSGDFTVQCWVYSSKNSASDQYILGQVTSGGQAANTSFQLYKKATTNVAEAFVYMGGSKVATSTATIPVGQWVHLAMVRDGGTLRLYVNGVQDGTNATLSTTAITDSGGSFAVGRTGDYDGLYFEGYVSNVSVVKGTCLFPSGTTFTPSTSPLSTSTSGQSVLLCTANRFIDTNTATTAKTVTVGGNTSIQPFSPFLPSAAYSPSVNGGSGYFDGSGDYLDAGQQTAFDLGTGAFTVEAWIYVTTLASISSICTYSNPSRSANGDQAYGFQVSTSGELDFSWTTGASTATSITSSSSAIFANTWHHVVAVKNSGTDAAIFIDGVRAATGTISTTMFTPASRAFKIGRQASNFASRDFDGYINSFRLVKGTAVYDPTQTTITVPTTPLTAISGTSILCNFTNAGIFDNTGKNNLETVADAQIDTSVKKYGTGSMEFDGTGDYLQIPSSTQFGFGTGDFTVEAWVYLNSNGATFKTIFSTRPTSSTGGSNAIYFGVSNNGQAYYDGSDGGTLSLSGTTVLSTSTWYHLAVVRSGTTITLYVNGTSEGTRTDSNTKNTNPAVIGGFSNGFTIDGYIDDLRITKGVARYTANFTPPTAAFPDL